MNHVLYGSYPEDTLYVYELNLSEDMASIYTPGTAYYLILMDGITSVTDEHPHYLSVRPNISFPVGGPYSLYGE